MNHGSLSTVVPLVLAALLDFWIGDPWGWLHPVQVMGWAIAGYTHWVFQHCYQPLTLRVAGTFLGLALVIGSGVIGWGIVTFAAQIHPLLGIGTQSILLASCLAARSLRAAAVDVLTPLEQGNLPQARRQLQQYVGRDTEHLEAAEILRAILETVTENATDGVMAPLFYGLLGAALPGVGSVPLALAYKAASTLDSTVGYREPPYTYLGWFSARMEDGLTWVPCRLTILTLALIAGKPRTVWRLCWRDAPP
ncbi:adenosylcobinamide-phosphate synthase CbiB [Neosynechococcus sphagnicola]|uniref:adenosylcobinamide-phosphate synthase CbiB n=1 Tax=Neosynechococcus sphagnicola TaxID=1501145 RepID=UPI000B333950